MMEGRQQTFSDEAIRRFLLGGLNSAEQSRFEDSLFVDESLEERVRLAELDLSDDYTANRLTIADRELFRQRFLLTADRERQLEVSRALHDNFARPELIAPESFWQKPLGGLDIRRHAWTYGFAALVLTILLLATALLIRKDQNRLAGPLRPPRVAPRASATATPQSSHHSGNTSGPVHTETSPELPLHDGLTTSIVLEPGTPLESAPMISTSGDLVTVQLRVDESPAESYEVSVTTMSGESVFFADGLKRDEEKMLGFDVPASSIKPGDFQVTLMRLDGESKQDAGTYYFRVR